MLDGTYELLISTPIGDKQGSATLSTAGDSLTADVKISGFPRQKGVGSFTGDSFTAEGTVKIPLLGKFEYRIEGSVQEDLLDAVCSTDRGSIKIAGIRV